MDTAICDTFLTGRKIEELIRQHGQIELNGHHLVQVDAISGENEGLTSVILRASLKWSPGSNNETLPELMKACIRCTSTKFRREKKDVILQRYVQLFNSKVTNAKNHIDLEKVEKAFNEMFAYLGALTMNCLGMEVGFTARLKGASEEERVEVREMIIPHVLDIFEDAAKILGW